MTLEQLILEQLGFDYTDAIAFTIHAEVGEPMIVDIKYMRSSDGWGSVKLTTVMKNYEVRHVSEVTTTR